MKARKLITFTLTLSIAASTLMGCATGKYIPFTDLSFDTSYDTMVKDLGEPTDEAESYLGTSYCYSSDYMADDSQVRYTYDEDGNMASISWIYESEDGEEVTKYYNDIHKQLENKYGKTKEATNDVTQLSDIWRLDSGNITLIALVSSEYNAVMYTYLSPDNSTKETK
ncbi:MAG: hypothetical protein K6F66_04215 [Pseudobutyrivibrio sp.]|nr:hypothetical protein [Pseudobutyrivibrio sp.]